MKKFIASVVSAAFLIATVAPSLAASPIAKATGLQGKVLVNHGKGFEVATGSVFLNAGDRLMVGEKSSVTVNYLNVKCTVSATNSTVLTVAAVAPCKSGTVVGSVDNVFATPVADPVDVDAGFVPPVFPILPVLIGTAVVVGGGYLLLRNCRNSVSGC
jgi:hypothetical protein